MTTAESTQVNSRTIISLSNPTSNHFFLSPTMKISLSITTTEMEHKHKEQYIKIIYYIYSIDPL